MKRILFLFFMFFAVGAQARELISPLGYWQTINEKTHQPGSIVHITQEGRTFVGRIEKLLPGSVFKTSDVCVKCTGVNKNKPIVGLKFLWGFVDDGKGGLTDGSVMDPNNGKVYSGDMEVKDHGKKLELRGYWGPFWRTETWYRAN